jgi:hypothetical protein
MSASWGDKGAAVLAGGSLTAVVVDDRVLVKKLHPASAIPTTATMATTAARCMI